MWSYIIYEYRHDRLAATRKNNSYSSLLIPKNTADFCL